MFSFVSKVFNKLIQGLKIVNKFLLAADAFMPQMHLRQPGFTYSASGPFTKNKGRIQKPKETADIKTN